jgi:hypothetical protein
MRTPEKLQEGWVKYSRFNCTEGCIDIWSGDCADNPTGEMCETKTSQEIWDELPKDNYEE